MLSTKKIAQLVVLKNFDFFQKKNVYFCKKKLLFNLRELFQSHSTAIVLQNEFSPSGK